jgi:hypothetical protein
MSFLRRLFGKEDKAPERDEVKFAQLIISALKQRDASIHVEYDAEKFELLHVGEGNQGQRMFLHNSFAEYQREDVTLERIVDFIVESQSQLPTGNAALDMLLPVLRPRADTLALVADSPQFSYSRSSRPFCDDMLLMLALDSEASIALLNDEKLDELGVSFDDALGIAIAQLDEKGFHTFGQLEEGIFVSACGDFYDSSRVLLDEMFVQLPLKGHPVAIIQSRSTVLVTGSEDGNGLRKIAEIALDELQNTERAVSLTPIELLAGKWRPFKILDHHPQALQNLPPNQLAWSCNATNEALQQKLGDDVFVANPMIIEKDGVHGTLVAWGAGVRTACPLVDGIAIQEDDGFEQIIRRLEDVLKVCGPFPQVEEMPYPPRMTLPSRMSSAQRIELTNNFPKFELSGNPL